MGFTLWHYLGRVGVIVIIPLVLFGMFAKEGTMLSTAGRVAYLPLAILGLIGATLAVLLLFTKFRFSCPQCRKRSTQFGVKKGEGVWLYCEECDLIVRETGFLKLKLVCEKVTEAPNQSTEPTPGGSA